MGKDLQVSKELNTQVQNFVTKLRRREVVGAYPVALETAYLMRNTVSLTRWTSADHLRETVKQVGKAIIPANPLELSIGNIVRRVLFIIREESATYVTKKGKDEAQSPAAMMKAHTSLSDIFGNNPTANPSGFGAAFRVKQDSAGHHDLKGAIIECINEIIEELESLYSSIASQSQEHIHSNEIIMVYGKSRTVSEFLKHVGKKRKFQVIVAEDAPLYDGQQMALSLAQAGIEVTLITDSAIFAMMARVNKVILSCHSVLANGGLLARSGSYTVAAAAKHHSTPVVVLTGLYKLSPVHAFDQDTFNSLSSPHKTLEYHDATFNDVDVVDPIYDYIPPEYVSLFVTNTGGYHSSYIYRLLNEYYHQGDYNLE